MDKSTLKKTGFWCGAALLGGLFYWVLSLGRAGDGTQGLVLLFSEQRAWVLPVWVVVFWSVAWLIGRLSGPCCPDWGAQVLFLALAVAGVLLGGSDQWLRNFSLQPATLMSRLTLESLFWFFLLVLVVYFALRFERPATVAVDSQEKPSQGLSDLPRSPTVLIERSSQAGAGKAQAILAFVVTAVVGGVMSQLLVPISQAWQVGMGLMLAFAVAGGAVHAFFPQGRVSWVLLSPMAVGLVGYLWAWLQGPSWVEAYFRQEAVRLALPLPIHYASAGVLGILLGWSWSAHEPHTPHKASQSFNG